MPYELFLAWRYLRSRRRGRLARLTAAAAVCGIACGVAALLLALALANGFRDEISEKILRGTAHISAAGRDRESALTDWREQAARVQRIAGVTQVSATTYDGALLIGADNASYAILRGVDMEAPLQLQTLEHTLTQGDLAPLREERRDYIPDQKEARNSTGDNLKDHSTDHADDSDTTPPIAIAIGADLAARTNLRVGDVAGIVSAGAALSRFTMSDADSSHDIGALDQALLPPVRRVRVAAIFRTGLYEYDATWIYLALPAAIELTGARQTNIVLNIETRNPDRVETIAADVRVVLGRRFTVVDWRAANRPLFAALNLERRVIVIIIALIVLVAALNITTSLALVVIERRGEIAVLVTLGARSASITAIFLLEGAIIGLAGSLTGVALGLALAFIGDRYHLVRLPAEVYSINNVPLHLAPRDVVAVAFGAIICSLLATIYPAFAAARARPAETLRYE